MGKMSKNDKQVMESIKFSLQVKEGQTKLETIKCVKKIPMGLPISPQQFRELFLQKPSNKALKS